MLASLAAHRRVTDGGKSPARTKHKNLAADKVGTALVIRTSSNRSPRLCRPPAWSADRQPITELWMTKTFSKRRPPSDAVRTSPCRSATARPSRDTASCGSWAVGMLGEVYLAQHPRLPHWNALKVLSATLTEDAEFT